MKDALRAGLGSLVGIATVGDRGSASGHAAPTSIWNLNSVPVPNLRRASRCGAWRPFARCAGKRLRRFLGSAPSRVRIPATGTEKTRLPCEMAGLLFLWLGQRDSNPRNRHQKPGSCRWTMPQDDARHRRAAPAQQVYLIGQGGANAIEQANRERLGVARGKHAVVSGETGELYAQVRRTLLVRGERSGDALGQVAALREGDRGARRGVAGELVACDLQDEVSVFGRLGRRRAPCRSSPWSQMRCSTCATRRCGRWGPRR